MSAPNPLQRPPQPRYATEAYVREAIDDALKSLRGQIVTKAEMNLAISGAVTRVLGTMPTATAESVRQALIDLGFPQIAAEGVGCVISKDLRTRLESQIESEKQLRAKLKAQ